MSRRRIAILVDGGFFLKRLPALVAPKYRNTPNAIANQVMLAAKSHIRQLTGSAGQQWMDPVYRIFFYDAHPYDGKAHHPTRNVAVDFAKSEVANQSRALFDCLRQKRKVALRLGKVNRMGDWAPPTAKVRKILGSRDWFAGIDFAAVAADGTLNLSADQVSAARQLQQRWAEIADQDIRLHLQQKGVDIRIGIDIAALALKRQADTIVLLTGDSDFVPAAKLARREGVEFILDPLWQQVNDDLFEHIDGLQSGFAKPRLRPAPPQGTI
jgi:uncharacterized LabA/DUF88 family protein